MGVVIKALGKDYSLHYLAEVNRIIELRYMKIHCGYQEIVDIALKGKRALLDGNWDLLGRLMNENHQIQDSLSYSGEQNNKLIKAALVEGALGEYKIIKETNATL